MSNLSYFSPSSERNTFIFANMDYSDSPLRSPAVVRRLVPLGAANNDIDDLPYQPALPRLPTPLLRRSPTVRSVMMVNMTIDFANEQHYVEQQQQQQTSEQRQEEAPMMASSYATTNESSMIQDTHDIDASKLMQVPAPSATTKKAKRSKHRRSSCVFI